ncbi:hypothetical protein BSKO_03181 [Bryopsis sp. KO-2023]|nr:hypothetical protein BSKO_03181 [Bryopsis sp. KO-2023]
MSSGTKEWVSGVENSIGELPFETRVRVVSAALGWFSTRGSPDYEEVLTSIAPRENGRGSDEEGIGADGLTQSPAGDGLVTRAAIFIAVLQAIPRCQHSNVDVLSAIETIVLPVLQEDELRQYRPEVSRLLSECLGKGGNWAVVSSIFRHVHRVLDEAPTVSDSQPKTNDALQRVWSFSVVTSLFPRLISAISEASIKSEEAKKICETQVLGLVPVVQSLILSENKSIQQIAVQGLLPSLMTPAIVMGPVHLTAYVESTWASCRAMLKLKGSMACAALGLIIRFVDQLGISGVGSIIDVTAEPEFWEELRSALVDPDTLTQKRARFIVKSGWEKDGELKGWRSHFLAIYDLLDEFALYFVQPNWHLMTDFDFDQDLIDPDGSEPGGCKIAWVRILWQKAFSHRNHQIQRLAVRSFLEKNWSESFVRKLGVDFVVDILMPVLSLPTLHGETSKFDLQVDMQRFLEFYAKALVEEEKSSFLRGLLRGLHSDIPRSAIQCWIACFESVAKTVGPSAIAASHYDKTVDSILPIFTNIQSYHGTTFKLDLYSTVLRATAAIMNPWDMEFALLGRFLGKLPDHLILPEGYLHNDLTDWLGKTDEHRNRLSGAMKFEIERFFAVDGCQEESEAVFSDMNSWKHGADSLVMMLCLGSSAGCQTDNVLNILGQNLQAMHSRPYLPHGTAAKTLLLLQGLLKAALRPTVISELGENLAGIAIKSSQYLAAFVEACSQSLAPTETMGSNLLEIEGFRTYLSPKQWGSCQKLTLGIHCLMDCLVLIEKSSQAGEKAKQTLVETAKRILWAVLDKLNVIQDSGEICDGRVEVLSVFLTVVGRICGGLASCLKEAGEKSVIIDAWTDGPDLESVMDFCLKISNILQPSKRSPIGTVSSQMLHLAEWQCLDSAFKMVDSGLYSMNKVATQTKAAVLRSALNSVEHAPDSVLLLILRCLRPLLKELLSDSALMSAMQNGSTEDHGVDKMMWQIVQSIWAAFLDSRKHALMAAIFVNLAFLDEVFACQSEMDDRWSLHESDGPMFWLIERLVGLGERSPRVMLLTTMKLSSSLIRWPCLVQLYTPHITSIILYGTNDKGSTDHRADPQGISNPELEEELSKISKGSDPDLVDAYMTARVAPRVAIVCFIYELSKLASGGESQEIRMQAGEAGRKLWAHLLDIALTDPQQTLTQYKTGSSTHRVKTRLWQALCVASNCLVEREEILEAVEKLGVLLQRGNVASIRMFMEATLTKLFIVEPDFMWEKLLPIVEDFTERQEALPSYMLVGLQVALACGNVEQLGRFLNAILPWSLSHHHATRVFAQLAVQTLLVRIRDLETDQEQSSMDGLRTKLMEFFDRNPDMEKQRGTLGGGLNEFYRKEIATPKSVFVSGPSLAGLEEDQIAFEGAPDSLIQKLRDFLTKARAKIRISNQEQIMAKEAGSQLVGHRGGSTPVEKIDGFVGDFQRKITPLDKAIAIQGGEGVSEFMQPGTLSSISMFEPFGSNGFVDFEDLVCSAGRHQTQKRQGVIMVASLIDKVPNLAGLARTCEVFRAQLLVMADLRVLKDKQFTAISTTAEQWMPMEEVPPAALLPWLQVKRSQGYALLGLEQTSESVVLPDYDFPRDCVVVLGREKEGIPAELLQVLDSTLEIPQLGIVRSLNVHVSGAVAVYEYSRQMRNKKGL